MRFKIVFLSLFAVFISATGSAEITTINTTTITPADKTSAYYQQILRDPEALRVFFEKMPKGGMLHEHFMGGDFPENLLDIGAKAKFCINPNTYRISTEGDQCPNYRRLMNIPNQPVLYNKIIDAWSMRNFVPSNTETAHDHFFNAFDKFFHLQNTFRGAVLASEVEEAANEKVDYLELSVLNEQDDVLKLAGSIPHTTDPQVMRQSLLKSGIAKIVEAIQRELTEDEKTMRQRLGCDRPNPMPACQVEVRYQYAAFRNGTSAQVFTGLLTGFLLAQQDQRVVGINLVGPEDAYPAMHDYTMHMRWVHFLHQQYPDVKITLHAGELTSALVPPQGLRNHIDQAINIGNAKRIGHGVDIAEEDNSAEILKQMRDNGILAEVNLTSNETILGVKGKDSPLMLYLQQGVPVALSRDDPGILRTNANQEFVLAAYRYRLPYATIKQMVNNSITYSFLQGLSLWENAALGKKVAACEKDTVDKLPVSTTCQAFLNQSEKAMMQWRVLNEFAAFEKQFDV
ncbi:MAG: add [Gammaproteobacteria bacterium]|jgi:hypothetical protein|nr:add [Gammaproteobacteria bacterium]